MRRFSLVASAIAAGTGVLYLGLLIKQGTPVFPFTVVLVTGALVALAGLTAYGSLGPDPNRRAIALWAAVPGLFGLGYLAGFSIGGLLLIGGVLTLPAAVTAVRSIPLERGAVLASILIILIGWAAVLGVLLVAASWLATY